MSSFPELRIPLCHDEINHAESEPPMVYNGYPMHFPMLPYVTDDDQEPTVISESPLTSLSRYWREAVTERGVISDASPRVSPLRTSSLPPPSPRLLAATKAPPAPFPTFAKYATSLPPRPLSDYELIASSRDVNPHNPHFEMSWNDAFGGLGFIPEPSPEHLDDDIMVNLAQLREMEAMKTFANYVFQG